MFNKFFYSLAIVAVIVSIAFLSNGCNDDSIPPVAEYPDDAATITDMGCYSTPIPTGCLPVNIHGSLYDSCYWTINLTNAGTFNGTYSGWCMDLGTTIATTQYNCAHMFSSLEPFPEYLKSSIEGWQDMDKINYLINHWHVGNQIQRKNYLCQNVDGLGTINAVDFQKAIWRILDEGPGNTYSELSDSLIVNALVCDMNANGEGFVPSCTNGDLIVFFFDPGLNPNGTRAQPVLAYARCCTGTKGQPVLAYARCCTTRGKVAWGDGKYGGQFAGNNWATYFKWCPTCP